MLDDHLVGNGSSTGGEGSPPSEIYYTYRAEGYEAPEVYTATDSNGVSGSASVDINITGQAVAAVLTATPTEGPAPIDVVFDGSATIAGAGAGATIASWTLDFGDFSQGVVASGEGPPPASIPFTYDQADRSSPS